VADNVCQKTLAVLADGTYANSRPLVRLEKIVQQADSWQKSTTRWEKRIVQLFGVGEEFAQARELLRQLRVVESSYEELYLLAEAEPLLLKAMYTKKQLSYQSVL
jgi:hypothetical protein